MTTHYTITVSAAELDVVRLALGRMVEPKPVPKRKAAVSAGVPFVSTGNNDLDAWMRRQYDRGVKPYRAKPLPKDSPLKPRQWTKDDHSTVARFNNAAIVAWRARGHEVVIGGRGGVERDGSNVTVLPRT